MGFSPTGCSSQNYPPPGMAPMPELLGEYYCWCGFQGSMHECIHPCALVQRDQMESLIKSVIWINLLFMLLASKC